MATARKKVDTSNKKAAKQPVKKAPARIVAPSQHEDIEEGIRLALPDGRHIDFRVTIASAPKIGPGPRPRRDETLLIRRIGPTEVLTISIDLDTEEFTGRRFHSKVGPGGRPKTGNTGGQTGTGGGA